jgi:hypothetical protein
VGTAAASQHGGHPAAMPGELRTTDGVDALVYAVETAGGEPMIDRIGAEPARQKLAPRNDAVLPSGE